MLQLMSPKRRNCYFFFCTIATFTTLSFAYPFTDVSSEAGLVHPYGKLKKYGGPAIADFDGDGYPDLLFGHHGPKPIQLYFNNRNGTFMISKISIAGDTHALNPIRLSPHDHYMHFVLSRGGAFGTKLTPPIVFRITDDRENVVEVTGNSPDFKHTRGRGRSIIFAYLRQDKISRIRPDVISFNAESRPYVFQVDDNNVFQERETSTAFEHSTGSFGAITDVDNDGQVEVVILSQLAIWKLSANYMFTDISEKVLPRDLGVFAASSFAEFDYDNDGKWDLIVTQSATNNLRWRKDKTDIPRTNVLLKNLGGRYVSVTAEAGIPTFGQWSESSGVTVGDFDNDGCEDIFITQYYNSPEMVLLKNLCDGTFRPVPHGFSREDGVPGTMSTAVDYDLDGRLDLIVAEGDWDLAGKGGYYRVIRNIVHNGNSFLLVRVKNAPGLKCTSLHAVVSVVTEDGVRMMRRVGSPGTTVSVSYIETVHFGLGSRTSASSVQVVWMDGTREEKVSVAANSTLLFGDGY